MSADDTPEEISVVLPSSLSAYHDFVHDLLQQLQELGWTKEVLFGIHMALEESISNAIRHGNNEDPSKSVKVDCQLSAGRFWSKICDEGKGYNPDEVPDCKSDENLQRPGGRGLELIRFYMTSVKHTDCGRCVEMEKILDQS